MGNKKVLDKDGLQTIWNIIKDNFISKKEGLEYPLYVKWKDSKNTLHDYVYNGTIPTVEGGNSLDFSDGVYYATTSTTATRVSNALTMHTAGGDITYNGHEKIEVNIPDQINITYNELVNLKYNSELIPGAKYRIIDYTTTTATGGSSSAGHDFDIIVEALNNYTLSEDAQAACRDGYDEENRIQELFVNTDVNNWSDKSNSSDVIPAKIAELVKATETISFQQYTRTCQSDGVVKITFVGTANYGGGDENIKGVGAALFRNGQLVALDYGLNKSEYILQIPGGSSNTQYIIKFYALGDIATLNSGVCGAKAEEFAGDYFKKSLLSSWIVKYSLENNNNRFAWAVTNGSGKGVIYYLKDEYDNVATFDFKNIKFNGKYVFNYNVNNTNYDGSVLYGKFCHNNIIGGDFSSASNYYMGLPEITFENTSANSSCYSNEVDADNWRVKFGNGCYNNKVYTQCDNITFNNGCNSNIVCSNSKTITFGNNCYSNKVDSYCENITFSANCSGNILGNYCKNTTFGDTCSNNVIGSLCESNSFGSSCKSNTLETSCISNRFGNNCLSNELGYNCNNNVFEANCKYNKLLEACSTNNFGEGCVLNVFDAECNNNSLGGGSSSNKFGYNCDSNEFSTNCSCNMFGNSCSSNRFYESSCNNVLGNNCTNIKHIDTAENPELNTNFKLNEFGDNCTNIKAGYNVIGNKFGNDCSGIILHDNCKYNTFGNQCYVNTVNVWPYVSTFELFSSCVSNTFGDNCYNIKLGANCSYNRFGENCYIIQYDANNNYNMLDSECHEVFMSSGCNTNIIGPNCRLLYFGQNCISNVLESPCLDITLNNSCECNHFHSACNTITLGGNSSFNMFSQYCTDITTGQYCQSNIFEQYASKHTLGQYYIRCTYGRSTTDCSLLSNTDNILNYCQLIKFADGCKYIKLKSSASDINGSLSSYIKSIHVDSEIVGSASSYKTINLTGNTIRNRQAVTTIITDSAGNIKQFYLADTLNDVSSAITNLNTSVANINETLENIANNPSTNTFSTAWPSDNILQLNTQYILTSGGSTGYTIGGFSEIPTGTSATVSIFVQNSNIKISSSLKNIYWAYETEPSTVQDSYEVILTAYNIGTETIYIGTWTRY